MLWPCAVHVAVCTARGLGNIRSVVRAVSRASGAEARVTSDPDVVRTADFVVVPGQGSFGPFASALEGGLGDALIERVRAGRPYLGICLGMQILFDESDEAPGVRGLGLLRGKIRTLAPSADPTTGEPLPLPHMGWNAVTKPGADDKARYFYFAHSYVAVPDDASVIAGTTDYGGPFVSAIATGSIVAVQFHPEKSQREGIALLERFFRSSP